MRKCHQCHHDLNEEDVFCPECGEAVKDDVQSKPQFCPNCGSPFKNDQPFCTNCGTPKDKQMESTIQTETKPDKQEQVVRGAVDSPEGEAQQTRTNEEPVSRTPKQPMAIWKKLLIVFAVLVILVGIGTYMYLKSYYDPIKDVVKLDEVIADGNMDEFYQMVEIDDDVTYDKENYFTYIKDNEWNDGVKADYLVMIEEEKEEPTNLQKEISNYDGEAIFRVKDKKILFGLFKNYQLSAIPVKVAATANMENTELKAGDKTFNLKQAEKTEELGEFYPGRYTFEAVTKTDYGDISIEQDYDIDAFEAEDVFFEFESDYFFVDVDYDYEDAILFVNGESTKEKISDIEEIGPVPTDGDVKVHAEWEKDDKTYRSRTVKLDNELGGFVYLEFDERIKLDAEKAEEIDYDLAEYILDFRGAYENAVNYADYDEIEDFMKPDSDEAKDLKKFVTDMDKADYYYEFGDNIITKVKHKDDKKFEVETNETFTFHDEDGSIYDYDRDKLYYIELMDDQYKIEKIDYKDTKKEKVN